MISNLWHLDETGRAAIAARAAEIRAENEAKRLLRATAQTLDIVLEERRQSSDRRTGVDRRGAVTVEVDGQVVIRPRSDLARFDREPADVSAFMLDDTFRGLRS